MPDVDHDSAPGRTAFAWRPVLAISIAFAILLVALANRYGYHRDELYFIAIGRHPAFGYTDEPPLIPLLAHGMDAAFGHSLVWLRLPPALAGAGVVLVTGLITREFGGGRAAQVLATLSMAVASVLFGEAHLAGTSVFDTLGWALALWLVVRALRDGGRTWLLVGLVVGVDLEVKTLIVFLLFALVVGVLAVGPREPLRSPWLYAGIAIALVCWAPNLVWEARHGWPQFNLAGSIAAGNSGSSQPWELFIPFQVVLIGPPLTPVWIAGLVRLWRDPGVRTWRGLAVAYVILLVVFLATQGKPYYICGMYPVLLAAGADPTLRWLARGQHRRAWFAGLVALSFAISATITLPIVPVHELHDTPVVAMNYDAGETVGWPRIAAEEAGALARVRQDVDPRAVILTSNYGEAGALFRFRPGLPVYSGHNSLGYEGRPPDGTQTVVAVGFDRTYLRKWFGAVRQLRTLDNGVGVDDDEQGEAVDLCRQPRSAWPVLWPHLRHLG